MNNLDYVIHKATESDVGKIEFLENQNNIDVYSKNLIISSINHENYINLIAENGENVLGYISASVIVDECELLKIIVASEFRRQKIGTKLLETLLKNIAEFGCKRVFLEVRKNNLPAITLYKSLGFEKISERINYYNDGETAEVYAIIL